MPRTTDLAVQGILDQDVTIPLTPFIEVANNLVTRVCVPALAADTDYVAADLELIERWLSAHFYCIRDAQRVQESVRGVSESFQQKVDLGLNQTRYGQQAMLIDTEGGLAALQKLLEDGRPRKVGITWLGQSLSKQEQARINAEDD